MWTPGTCGHLGVSAELSACGVPCENPQQPHMEFCAQVQKPQSYGPRQSSLDLEELYRNLEQLIEGHPRRMFGCLDLEVYHHLPSEVSRGIGELILKTFAGIQRPL